MLLLLLTQLALAEPSVEALLTLPTETPELTAARRAYLETVERHTDVPWRTTSQRLAALRPVPPGDYRVVAQLVLDAEGQLVSARIVGSSGQTPVDHAALAALRAAQPFPHPPSELIVDGSFLVPAHELHVHSTAAQLPASERYPPGANPDEPSAFPGLAPEPTEKWPGR